MADQTILVIVDPTAKGEQAPPAIERAAWLAERAGAAIELYICDYDASIDAGEIATVWIPQPVREDLIAIHRKTLESRAEPLRKRGLAVTVSVDWDHPLGEAMVRKVVAAKPWLVAKETHHHNLLKRTLLSNTDWHLIRGCPAPLLLVKDRPVGEKPIVLAAVDPLHERDRPAHLDDKIFRAAEMLARTTGGELHVVHTFGVPIGMELPLDVGEAIEKQHRQVMAAFLYTHPVPEGRAHVLEGRPEHRLPDLVEELGAAFLVMGAVSRRGLDRLLIGSTAERVLDRLPCDPLIVKPDDFKLALPHGA